MPEVDSVRLEFRVRKNSSEIGKSFCGDRINKKPFQRSWIDHTGRVNHTLVPLSSLSTPTTPP